MGETKPLRAEKIVVMVSPDELKALDALPGLTSMTVGLKNRSEAVRLLIHNAATKARIAIRDVQSPLAYPMRQKDKARGGLNRRNKSGYKGVYRDPTGKWGAKVRVDGERVYLGLYETPEMAAEAIATYKALFSPTVGQERNNPNARIPQSV